MQELDNLDLSDTPTIDSLKLLIGEDLLAELSVAFGGMVVTIPRQPGEHSPIASVIGLDAARKISHVYGGMNFSMPIGAGLERKVLALYQQGISKNRIAQRLGITRPRIDRILERAFLRDQLRLFD